MTQIRKPKVLLLIARNQSNSDLARFINLDHKFDFGNFIYGLKAICEDVIVFDVSSELFENTYFGMNAAIVKLALSNKVDFLINPTIYYELSLSAIEKLARHGVKVVNVFFDDSMRYNSLNLYYYCSRALFVSNESPNIKKPSPDCQVTFFPNYPSQHYYRNLLSAVVSVKNHDVVFVGSNIADRQEYLTYLQSAGYNVGVYGKNWTAFDSNYVSTEEMICLYAQSKISLVFTKSLDLKSYQFKGRVFEVALSRGVCFCEYFDGIEQYFEIGKEIEVFLTKEELLEKIAFYLANNVSLDRLKLNMHRKVHGYTFEDAWYNYLNSASVQSIPQKSIRVADQETLMGYSFWFLGLIKYHMNKKRYNHVWIDFYSYIKNIPRAPFSEIIIFVIWFIRSKIKEALSTFTLRFMV